MRGFFPVPSNVYRPPLPQVAVEARQRRGLLAKIHIAKQQMGMSDDEYEMFLRSFKVSSAADMTIKQMENMVKLMKHYGWKPIAKRRRAKSVADPDRLAALRARVMDEIKHLDHWQERLGGLTRKICGVSNIAWCRDAAKLERLLAVLGKIKSTESATKFKEHDGDRN